MSAMVERSDVRAWPEIQVGTPPLSTLEREALQQSITEFGVHESVKVLPDGRIVDGHHRWELSSGTAPVSVIDLPEASARLLGRALNCARRHMSAEQMGVFRTELDRDRLAARELVGALRADGLTQTEVADRLGVGRSTVARWESGTSIVQVDNTCTPPDYRVRIPWGEQTTIYARHVSGESQTTIAADYHVTQQRVSQIVTQEAKRRAHASSGDAAEPDAGAVVPIDGFRVILADPPWSYTQQTKRLNGTTESHYKTMGAEAIAALPVADIAADDAVLLLWTTWPFLATALDIISHWGFTYTTGLPWIKVSDVGTEFDGTVKVKPRTGVGFWFRGATEPLLLAKRGKPARSGVPWDGILSDRNVHSRKPDSVYEMAECLGSPRIELFARRRRDGWTSIGHGVDSGRDITERLHDLAR